MEDKDYDKIVDKLKKEYVEEQKRKHPIKKNFLKVKIFFLIFNI